jgi:sortase A
MTIGDVFYIVYKSEIYKYKVTKVEIVSPTDTFYYSSSLDKKTATLMTCWPPATTLKRLIVIGESL